MARTRHFLRRFRVLAATLAALLAAVLSWLLFAESGLTWAAAMLERNSGGQVRIEGVHGRLSGPLRLERLQVVSGSDRYTLHDFELSWSPLQLLGGLLEIHALKVARIDVLWPDDAAPVALPASLRLPFKVRLDALEIGVVEMHGAARPLARDLKMTLHGDGGALRFDALSVVIDAGTLTGQGTLATAAPFGLRAEARLAGSGIPALHVAVQAGGTLEAITVGFDSQEKDFSVTGQASLRPFAAFALSALRVTARGLDPRAFAAAAPRALLALDIDLALQDDGALGGRLYANNAAPLALDRGGLPFSRAEAGLALHWGANPRRLRLDDLKLAIGTNGAASGRVDLAWPEDAHWPQGEADLKVKRLDPSVLHSVLRSASLSGTVMMSGDAGAQQATLALADGTRRLGAELVRRSDTLTLSRLRLSQGAAELAGAGELQLGAERAWRLAGALRHFDPSAFADVPRADLNAEFDANGRFNPQLDGRLRFSLASSRLADQPLTGTGDLNFAGLDRPDQLVAANGKAYLRGALDIRLGGSRLHMKGGWGGAGEKLAINLKVPDLVHHRALFPELAANMAGPLDLSVDGAPGQHRLRIGASLPDGRTLELAAAGALRAPSQDWRAIAWRGRVETLSLSGSLPLELAAPASLAANRAHITLGATELAFAGGSVMLADISWQPGRWSSSGRFTGIALRPGDEAHTGMEPLRIGGGWSLSGGAYIEGWLRANRESGDWILPGILPPEMRVAGLEALHAHMQGTGGRVNLDIAAAGSRIGRWQAGATLPPGTGAHGFSIPQGQLTGWLKASVADLSWVGPSISGNMTSAGSFDIDARLAGTLKAPVLQGHVRGSGLAIGLIDQNVRLHDGELAIRFDRERVLLERLVFIAPHQPPPRAMSTTGFASPEKPGRLSIEGEFDLRQRDASFSATLARLPLSQRAERWVVASGTARLDHGANRQRGNLRIGADLVADAGFIAESAGGSPELAGDIVVLGQLPAERRGASVEGDVAFDLGKHFYLRAAGLAARLAGRLRVRGSGGGPLAATGSIATHDATFDAYGQRLVVERGIVNFQGPLDDPGLNVLALRKGLAVEAGVTVTGTAQKPVVRLVSTPPVPDAEKLSWIVLGRPADAGGTDASLLLAAAGAIFGGQDEGVTAQLAQALGIDEISLRQASNGDPLTGQILTLGKRLSARTHLGYEQGLTAATGAVKLTHALTPHVSVVTRSGEDNAIDMFYHFAFD